MNKKEIIRRSISIPKDLDEIISIVAKKYSYRVKNELIVELLELGLLKYNEDLELKNKIDNLMNKIDKYMGK